MLKGLLQQQRRQAILSELGTEAVVSVAELAQRFDVSPMTVRRDLQHLTDRGLIARVHGGALPADSTDLPVMTRASTNTAAKGAIARIAADLVQANDVVALDAGTTVAALARALVGKRLTIVTHSFLVVDAMSADDTATIHFLGGTLRKDTMSSTGPQVAEQYSNYHVRIAFIGASSLDNGAAYNARAEDTAIQRALINSAADSYLLIDRSKYNAPAVGRICTVNELTDVISETG